MTEVILVDKNDQARGQMEKLQAHQQGELHRAITVYLFNSQGEVMLQQRAAEKYHCGNLWSNTCCGHPMPGESTPAAASRRLGEEMGVGCELTPVFTLQYRLPLANGLTEHEFGHVFFGTTDQAPTLNPQEARAWRWQSLPALTDEIATYPERFTPWFVLTMAGIPAQYQLFNQPQIAD